MTAPHGLQGARAAPALPIEGAGLVLRRGNRTLIDAVDVVVDGTGITAVMGPNGAGKSLLLRLLAGLVTPDAGRVTWAGAPPDRRRATRVGVVFQRPVMLRRSALANVAYALAAAGVPRAGREDRARAALRAAGLERLAHWPARLLSGGEQQRVALARALAPGPEALMLDEPTSNLDPASTQAIEDLVRRARDDGTRVLLVTHDLGQARRLADDILFLHGGRIEERAEARRFLERPATPKAAAFVEGRLVL